MNTFSSLAACANRNHRNPVMKCCTFVVTPKFFNRFQDHFLLLILQIFSKQVSLCNTCTDVKYFSGKAKEFNARTVLCPK